MKPHISQERLREVFCYSPIVGVFEWRRGGRRIRKGGLAGAVTRAGYVRLCVDGRLYEAHRLAWLYMTGEWPEQCIDHIDGDRSNNAFKNLRLAEYADNSANMRVNCRSTTGIKASPICITATDGELGSAAAARWCWTRYSAPQKRRGLQPRLLENKLTAPFTITEPIYTNKKSLQATDQSIIIFSILSILRVMKMQTTTKPGRRAGLFYACSKNRSPANVRGFCVSGGKRGRPPTVLRAPPVATNLQSRPASQPRPPARASVAEPSSSRLCRPC